MGHLTAFQWKLLELETKVSKRCDQLSFLSYLFQFISVLRGKKRKESNANVETKEINGESKAESEPGEKEAALSLCPQPRPTQAPSMTNRLEFSRWVRQTVQEQIEWCRRLVDISESEDEELTYSSMVSLTDLDGPCWTRQEEWKQVSSVALCSVGCGCLLRVCSSVMSNLSMKSVGRCTDRSAERLLQLQVVEFQSNSALKFWWAG